MIYFTLDDFCDEHAAEFEPLLQRILKRYPHFKATLFTIPKKTSPKLLNRWFLKYPCLQFAVHGLTHEEGETWFLEYDLAIATIKEHFGEVKDGRPSKLPGYVAGFKAPWWKLGLVCAHAFNDMGYWVATNGTHTVDEHKLELYYNYKRGCTEIHPDMLYQFPARSVEPQHQAFFWHGHVQSQRRYNQVNPNGLPDIIELFLSKFDPKDKFGFVSTTIPF